MEQSTKTMRCGNCGVPIARTAHGYTHIPDLGTPGIACNDPSPNPTKTVNVTATRRTTPAPFAALGCLMAHSFRVVLKGKEPTALECTRCAMVWTTERAT
jgi:hypothetical protein